MGVEFSKEEQCMNNISFSMSIIKERLQQSAQLKEEVGHNETVLQMIAITAETISNSIKMGGKILICGNGGSASDALHFCGEIVGRFQKERKAAPAIALNADVATMTAIANDYGYNKIFERSVQAYMKPEDVLIGISTSGSSENVLMAVKAANEIGGKTIGLLGKTGGDIAREVNIPVIIPNDITARIQECHICIIHIICELLENIL